MHVRSLPRTRRHPAVPTAEALALTAPTLRRGDDLGPFAVQVRRAIQLGATSLLVDESACADWTPGQLLVLEHLRRLAHRCGTAWVGVGASERCSL